MQVFRWFAIGLSAILYAVLIKMLQIPWPMFVLLLCLGALFGVAIVLSLYIENGVSWQCAQLEEKLRELKFWNGELKVKIHHRDLGTLHRTFETAFLLRQMRYSADIAGTNGEHPLGQLQDTLTLQALDEMAHVVRTTYQFGGKNRWNLPDILKYLEDRWIKQESIPSDAVLDLLQDLRAHRPREFARAVGALPVDLRAEIDRAAPCTANT